MDWLASIVGAAIAGTFSVIVSVLRSGPGKLRRAKQLADSAGNFPNGDQKDRLLDRAHSLAMKASEARFGSLTVADRAAIIVLVGTTSAMTGMTLFSLTTAGSIDVKPALPFAELPLVFAGLCVMIVGIVVWVVDRFRATRAWWRAGRGKTSSQEPNEPGELNQIRLKPSPHEASDLIVKSRTGVEQSSGGLPGSKRNQA